MRTKHERKWYTPKGSTKITAKDSDAIVYVYDRGQAPYALGFHGRAQKPDFHHRFRTTERRETVIREFFESHRLHVEMMAERRNSGKPSALKIGNILYSSWGYDQTNVDFYEVTALVGRTMVEIREIDSTSTENGSPSARVSAVQGAYTGAPMKKRVSRNGDSVKIASYAHAYLWDGTPKHVTGACFGH